MNVSEFDYELPPDRIAQEPLPDRGAARLLVLDRSSGAASHSTFADLPDLLRAGDLVVMNDTRVLPARLVGTKPTGGRVELLLLDKTRDEAGEQEWECLSRAGKPLSPGAVIDLGNGLTAEVVRRSDDRTSVRIRDRDGDPDGKIEEIGRMPVPPYIHRSPDDPRSALDRERYQTVFARRPGAVAAPTAGLHVTPALLERLASRGVATAFVTLHVGPGTFLPVRCDRVEDHRLHEERFELPETAAEAVRSTRAGGGRVVAVGTTVVRTLEASANEDGTVRAGSGACALFIYPGHRFRVIDGLVTNFHLPRSTLLMLVSAFGGRQNVLAAYREAVRAGYRFYSYGDAMFLG